MAPRRKRSAAAPAPAAAAALPLLLLLAGGLCGKGEAFLRPGVGGSSFAPNAVLNRQQGQRAGVAMMTAYSEPKPLPNDPPFRIGHGFDIHRLEPGKGKKQHARVNVTCMGLYVC